MRDLDSSTADTVFERGRSGSDQEDGSFSPTYKRAILREVDHSPESTREVLTREGLFFSDVLRWREEEDRAELREPTPAPTATGSELDELRATICDLMREM